MPNVIRTRNAPSVPWPLLVAGALAGALASVLLLRSRSEDGDGPSPAGPSVTDATAAPAPRRGLRRAPVPPDLAAIAERLHARPGTQDLQLRSLGGGILELVGSAPDELDLAATLQALADEPNVSVVVNRVWTSRSGTP